jgi:hypothetical protein
MSRPYVTLGNAHKLGLLNRPKEGLLDVVYAVQFPIKIKIKKIVLAV